MKKVIGYILRIVSIFLFLIFVASFFISIFDKKAFSEDTPFLIGYIIGNLIVTGLFSWLNWLLYKYSGKLIYQNKNISEIDDIGKE